MKYTTSYCLTAQTVCKATAAFISTSSQIQQSEHLEILCVGFREIYWCLIFIKNNIQFYTFISLSYADKGGSSSREFALFLQLLPHQLQKTPVGFFKQPKQVLLYIWKGRVWLGVGLISWLQTITSPIDTTKSYTICQFQFKKMNIIKNY